MPDWRPIETAPRAHADMDCILACDSRVAGGWQHIVYWDSDKPEPFQWHLSEGEICFHKDAFTHWMPLPMPPATVGEGVGQK